MKYLVKTKDSDKYFFVKIIVVETLGIFSGLWVGCDDNKIYQPDELLFIDDTNNLINLPT